MPKYCMNNILISQTEFEALRWKDEVPVQCFYCKKLTNRPKRGIMQALRCNRQVSCGDPYCSKIHSNQIDCTCRQCNAKFIRKQSHIRGKNVFCSQTCFAIFNNTHNKQGYQRSKLEKWIELQLVQLYPNLEIIFNNRTTVNSELDIYIPILKIAVELNGIFHYEPIYSSTGFNKIQQRDKQKLIECYKNGIELCVIDTTSQKYFSVKSSNPFLSIITNLIDNNIGRANL
jgi:hypothetical protein